MVGGVGTRVIQAEQEDLMAEAWNQVGDVEAANRALRLAQLAKQLSASLHQRHLATMSEAGLLAATERVHAKVLVRARAECLGRGRSEQPAAGRHHRRVPPADPAARTGGQGGQARRPAAGGRGADRTARTT